MSAALRLLYKWIPAFAGMTILCLFLFPKNAFAEETSYTYTNQEQDKSGLMHYDSRYYDPELGRFLQPDSYDVPNKYAYVSNDPVNRVDPTGHTDFPFYEDSWVFSGIDPTNTDTYSTMFSDALIMNNNFVIGNMVGPWGNLNSNLYLDAAEDIAKEQAFYKSNDARLIGLSYEDYKSGNRPLFVDSSFGVNPVGMLGGVSKALTKAGMIDLVEKEILTEKQAIELINKASSPFTGKQTFGGSCVDVACNIIIQERNSMGAVIYSEAHAFAVSANEVGAIQVFDKKPFLSLYYPGRSDKLTFFQELISEDAMSPHGAPINDYFMLKLDRSRWFHNDPSLKTFNYFYWDW